MSQFFRKLDNGAKRFFGKNGGFSSTLRKIGSVAGQVGNIASQATPILTSINPELGMASQGLASVARGVQGGSKAIDNARKAVYSGNIKGGIQAVKPLMNQVQQSNMPSFH